jgi:hypothetical protein
MWIKPCPFALQVDYFLLAMKPCLFMHAAGFYGGSVYSMASRWMKSTSSSWTRGSAPALSMQSAEKDARQLQRCALAELSLGRADTVTAARRRALEIPLEIDWIL